jgi:hypothetical protein
MAALSKPSCGTVAQLLKYPTEGYDEMCSKPVVLPSEILYTTLRPSTVACQMSNLHKLEFLEYVNKVFVCSETVSEMITEQALEINDGDCKSRSLQLASLDNFRFVSEGRANGA